MPTHQDPVEFDKPYRRTWFDETITVSEQVLLAAEQAKLAWSVEMFRRYIEHLPLDLLRISA